MDHIELLDKLFDENADPADYVFDVAEVVTNLVERLREAQNLCDMLLKELANEKKRADEAEKRIFVLHRGVQK